MDTPSRITKVAWFAGLFEGEGTFNFANGKPKAMSIQMTDEDVLNRVQKNFGGSVHLLKKRQDHWKDCWKWSITGQKSVDLAKEIKPFLLSRRQARCEEYIKLYKSREAFRQNREDFRTKVKHLRSQGLTHAAIAGIMKCDRSYVSHILAGTYDSVVQ